MRNVIHFITSFMCIGVGLLIYFSNNPSYSKYKKYWYVLVILGALTLFLRTSCAKDIFFLRADSGFQLQK
jgi:hypothetical protein